MMIAAGLALGPVSVRADGVAWEQWKSIPGVFDVGGPRNGFLVVAGSAALYLIHPEGEVATFARGSGGYHDDPGAEAYLAVSPGGHVGGSDCDFVKDETFILRLHSPPGVTRVDAAGVTSASFATVSGVSSLNGIAFDTTGAFDHRLLVSGYSGGKMVISAIDCKGGVHVITSSAPTLEGGLAVAPRSFGSFGGDIIAPDELSGRIYAIAPDGTVTVVAKPALPTGGDVGVESVGFVPGGFMRGGKIYYSDRSTPGNPHPGTDSLLRLSSADLAMAGVQDGDMLVATEGGATMVAVRCAASCLVIPVVTTPTTAHGEGHIAFTVDEAPSTPTPSLGPIPISTQGAKKSSYSLPVAAAVAIVLVAALAGIGLLARQRRG